MIKCPAEIAGRGSMSSTSMVISVGSSSSRRAEGASMVVIVVLPPIAVAMAFFGSGSIALIPALQYRLFFHLISGAAPDKSSSSSRWSAVRIGEVSVDGAEIRAKMRFLTIVPWIHGTSAKPTTGCPPENNDRYRLPELKESWQNCQPARPIRCQIPPTPKIWRCGQANLEKVSHRE
jgi:hypothetical protein